MASCFFCGTPAKVESSGARCRVDCFRCGRYNLTTEAEAFLELGNDFTAQQRGNISGYIRENEDLTIYERDLAKLKLLTPPTVAEKAMKGLLAVARRHPIPGTPITLEFSRSEQRRKLLTDAEKCDDSLKEALEFQGRCWAVTFTEAEYLSHSYFPKLGWTAHSQKGNFQVTPQGWAEADKSKHGKIESDSAFVAMAFRESLRPLFEEGILPGITNAGYKAVRVDRTHHNNKIDDEIIALIRKCKFVVADFSLNRGGIYFEAGFAMGLNRPVIWTAREDRLNRIHFDTRQYNFVRWWPGQCERFAEDLKNRIEATLGRGSLLSG